MMLQKQKFTMNTVWREKEKEAWLRYRWENVEMDHHIFILCGAIVWDG